jgi:uncharacterized damage-inducible protein DinB
MEKDDLSDFAEQTYKASAQLMALVPEDKLHWRPSPSGNWWTTGQLLHHLSYSTGGFMQGVLKGQWPSEDGTEALPDEDDFSVSSVADALDRLEADRVLTARLLAELPEEEFCNREMCGPRPCEPDYPYPLRKVLHHWVLHQIKHQTMLFAYLKLLGVEVGTAALYAGD